MLLLLSLFFSFARHLLSVALVANDLLSISLGFRNLLLPSSFDSWVFLSEIFCHIFGRLSHILIEWVVILEVIVQFIGWRLVVIEVNLFDGALSFRILDNVFSFAAQTASERIHGFDWVS